MRSGTLYASARLDGGETIKAPAEPDSTGPETAQAGE
jgi:hypothetical protein